MSPTRRIRSYPKRLLATSALALLTGCAASGLSPDQSVRALQQHDDDAGRCARLYRDTDRLVTASGVRDAQAAPVRGAPYLRLDRFLADGIRPAAQGPTFEAWVDRLRALDRRARAVELANLPIPPPDGRLGQLDRCARILRERQLGDPRARAALLTATVPDAYQNAARVLGLYPLASLPFMLGVRNLHRETRATFATPLPALPVTGALQRFGPPPGPRLSPEEIARILTRAADNPLAIPEPADDELTALFQSFAPVWEIDVASAADTPGHPSVRTDGAPRVDGAAVVYTLVSHARWQNRTVLQLNYVLWFPARPRQGAFDLVGGRLDGVMWRVTIGTDGRPLLYDVVHSCGCYYKALPTPRVAVVTRRRGWEEPLSIPQTIPDGGGRTVLRIAATSHYLQRVYRDSDFDAEQTRYRLEDYMRLRSLPLPGGGRRSLFRADGIVAGTERRERWLFWPMGVPEPGAMRQWGNHAIAFVGRRHFDEPGLLQRYFAPQPGPP